MSGSPLEDHMQGLPQGKQAGWTNLVLSMRASRPTINWWRVNGLAFAVAFSCAVWVLLAIVTLT
jgi:hypothetical protein